jgi:glutathione S-transferase
MFAAVATVEPPIVEWSGAMILERDKPWFDQRLPQLQAAIRKRLAELSRRLSDSEWLDGDFSAADIMMTHVIERARSSGLIEEFPNLGAYLTRAESRPAFQRAFAAQLKVFEQSQAKP